MAWDYTEKKIKEALHLHRNNMTRTRQQVIAWAMEDPKLLRELMKPHMTGITAHAVNRVMNGKTKPEPVPQAAQASDKSSDKAKEGKDTFGLDILKTIAGGNTTQFGQETYGNPPSRRGGVSQRHLDAIQQMINKGHKD